MPDGKKPDWKTIVRERMPSLSMAPDVEEDVIAELAVISTKPMPTPALADSPPRPRSRLLSRKSTIGPISPQTSGARNRRRIP